MGKTADSRGERGVEEVERETRAEGSGAAAAPRECGEIHDNGSFIKGAGETGS